jgi:hypothetical protein
MAVSSRFRGVAILAVGLAAATCGRTELPEVPETPAWRPILLPAEVAAADLMDYIETFVGDDAVECGRHHLAVDQAFRKPVAADLLEASVACAAAAALERRAFWAYSQQRSIDSWVASGLLGVRGSTMLFWYDSAPSGNYLHSPPGRFSIQRCRGKAEVVETNGAPTFGCHPSPMSPWYQ